jgi:hypothetical protein
LLSCTSTAGEFAAVQQGRRRGEARAPLVAIKHIDKAHLVCPTDTKRTVRRVRRVGTEIKAMQAVDSP